MNKPTYTINRALTTPSLDTTQGVPAQGWSNAEIGEISEYHEKSCPIRPRTYFRALYDDENIYVRFDVMDTFVKVEYTKPNDPVCVDSCVEFFIEPAPGPTYFNFEINAGGTMLLYRITDYHYVKKNGTTTFAAFGEVPLELAQQVEIHTSLPKEILTPIEEPISWTVCYRIPLSLFSEQLGTPCKIAAGDKWRGNLYKCGGSDHFGMWSRVGGELNFHQPEYFGDIIFG